MWCKNCQQDVPAIAASQQSGPQRQFCCARCHEILAMDFSGAPEDATPGNETGDLDNDAVARRIRPPTDIEDWDLGLDLADADYQLATDAAPRALAVAAAGESEIDARLATTRGQQLSAEVEKAVQKPDSVRPRSSIIGWSLTLLGLTVFVCGGVLMGWSLARDRDELWHVGLPLVLAGQGALLIGVVFQLERVWSNHRKASDALNRVGGELADFRNAATLLERTRGAAAPGFPGRGSDSVLADASFAAHWAPLAPTSAEWTRRAS